MNDTVALSIIREALGMSNFPAKADMWNALEYITGRIHGLDLKEKEEGAADGTQSSPS